MQASAIWEFQYISKVDFTCRDRRPEYRNSRYSGTCRKRSTSIPTPAPHRHPQQPRLPSMRFFTLKHDHHARRSNCPLTTSRCSFLLSHHLMLRPYSNATTTDNPAPCLRTPNPTRNRSAASPSSPENAAPSNSHYAVNQRHPSARTKAAPFDKRPRMLSGR